METIYITHHNCGYYAVIGSTYLKLFMARIVFYDENGIIVECRLSQWVGFTMTVDCGFHMSKTFDYTSNEVHAFKADLGSIGKKCAPEYVFCIPAKAVGLRKVRNYAKYVSETGLTLTMYTKWSFKANDLVINNYPNDPDFRMSENGQRIIFETFKETAFTPEGEEAEKMQKAIEKICDIKHISFQDLGKILKHFELKYKGPVDRLNKPIYKGAKVKWYDPEEESRDLSREWTVDKIKIDPDSNEHDDTVILISDEYSEAEVLPCELVVI